MEKILIFILRCALITFGVGVLAICIFIAWFTVTDAHTRNEYHFYYFMFIVYASALPLYIGLHQGLKLLAYIDKKCIFSLDSVKSLTIIARCSIVYLAIWLLGGVPYLAVLGQADDSPGLFIFALILSSIAFIVAVFSILLGRLISLAVAQGLKNI